MSFAVAIWNPTHFDSSTWLKKTNAQKITRLRADFQTAVTEAHAYADNSDLNLIFIGVEYLFSKESYLPISLHDYTTLRASCKDLIKDTRGVMLSPGTAIVRYSEGNTRNSCPITYNAEGVVRESQFSKRNTILKGPDDTPLLQSGTGQSIIEAFNRKFAFQICKDAISNKFKSRNIDVLVTSAAGLGMNEIVGEAKIKILSEFGVTHRNGIAQRISGQDLSFSLIRRCALADNGVMEIYGD